MENQRQSGQAVGADAPGKLLRGNRAVAIFLDVEILRAEGADFDEVLEVSGFVGDWQAERAELVVLDVFGGGEAADIFDELLDAVAGGADDVVELAGGAGVEHEVLQVDVLRQP